MSKILIIEDDQEIQNLAILYQRNHFHALFHALLHLLLEACS